ncbi:beta-galactosidase [Joostella sp.]|uniref:beta-galactosidase n=1 Tax=Joostella sp. TaxID=2231138 RepID=UPI003A938F91
MRHLIFFIFILISFTNYGQKGQDPEVHFLDLNIPEKVIDKDYLKLGGKNKDGKSIEVNNFYISINGKPTIPITGEIHFSRYQEAYWEEAIKKMKAGGINIIATYIFWNIHEENEGVFEWDKNLNVRKFIQLCAKHQMPVIIRIGPFGHGEIRNGALPDWLLAKPLTIRSNDVNYLAYVEKLYNEIGRQLKGLYFKDGGPIIATQIENEYQSSAAPWGLTYPGQPLDYTSADRDRDVTQEGVGVSNKENPYSELGNEHIKILKKLANNAGIITPLYTVTGWGNAAIIPGESLPVTAAYPYPTWTKKRDFSPFYLYNDMHETPDYSPVRYNATQYPAFAAELGGGIMSTYNRRPVVPANSLDALINRCLGSGANGIGYYMYHGGSTPRGENNFFNDEAYGYPKISYDFQAPIGEYGQINPSFHRLKLLHEFINSFGDKLAPMQTILPENVTSIKPDNLEDLRFAVREKDGAGFVFINNFQDHALVKKKDDIKFKFKKGNEFINLPEEHGFSIAADENAIFPFNLDVNGANLNYATAQLLTKFKNNDTSYYVFFSPEGVLPEFSFKNNEGIEFKSKSKINIESNSERWLIKANKQDEFEFTIENGNEAKTRVLVVSKKRALDSWIVDIDKQKVLLFSKATVLPMGDIFEFFSTGNNEFDFFMYPKSSYNPILKGTKLAVASNSAIFSHFKVELALAKLSFTDEVVSDRRLVVNFKGGIPESLHNVFMKIDYVGDTGMGFLNNKLVADEFYKGLPWVIGLRAFVNLERASTMNFYFRPLYKNAPFLVDLDKESLPDFSKQNSFINIKNVEYIPEYKALIKF